MGRSLKIWEYKKLFKPRFLFLFFYLQKGNHSSMWAISQGSPATEIAHFERMGLDDLFLNSLILTREQAIREREGNSLLIHAHHHTLAHPLFFLSGSFFLSKFPIFSLIFHPFSYLFFSCFISPCFPSPFFCSPPLSLLCTAKALFILPTMTGFYCFTP